MTRIPRKCSLCHGILALPTAAKSKYHGECRQQAVCIKANARGETGKKCPACAEFVLFGDRELTDYHEDCAAAERNRREGLAAEPAKRYWVVMMSDPKAEEDQMYCYARRREDGEAMARKLNSQMIDERGMPGPGNLIPLFYAVKWRDAIEVKAKAIDVGEEMAEALPSLTSPREVES